MSKRVMNTLGFGAPSAQVHPNPMNVAAPKPAAECFKKLKQAQRLENLALQFRKSNSLAGDVMVSQVQSLANAEKEASQQSAGVGKNASGQLRCRTHSVMETPSEAAAAKMRKQETSHFQGMFRNDVDVIREALDEDAKGKGVGTPRTGKPPPLKEEAQEVS